MGDSGQWQDDVKARFLREVERDGDVYDGLTGPSLSHRWVTEEARKVAKEVLQCWSKEARTSKIDESVRDLLTNAVMSKIESAIDWPSLRKHFSKPPEHSDTFGTVQLAVALVHAAAVGVPDGLGTRGGNAIKSLPEPTRTQAREILSGFEKLTVKNPPVTSNPPPPVPLVQQATAVPPASVRPAPVRDWVRCPTSTADYRLIVIGEVPQHGLHPVAFVNPRHQPGIWYAQEKPLVFKEGVAFCAYLNLGNPLGVGWRPTKAPPSEQQTPPFQPLDYFLKVYALQVPWEFRKPHVYRKAFKEDELEASLLDHAVKFCWPPAHSGNSWRPSDNPWKIQRDPPAIDAVQVSDAKTNAKQLEIPAELTLVSPVTLSWVANGTSYVEIRKALDYDSFVKEVAVVPIKGRCTIDLAIGPDNTNSPDPTVRMLPKPDFYRIKLFPERPRRFLDPLHELWIHIQVEPVSD